MTQRDIFLVANEVNELGGVGRWQIQLATLLAERGHRVTVVGIAPPHHPMDLGERPPSAPRPSTPAVRRAGPGRAVCWAPPTPPCAATRPICARPPPGSPSSSAPPGPAP